MAVGDTITAARYNTVQSRIGTILGTGSGTSGYGQTLSSSQVAVSSTVTVNQINNLITDMKKARQHQTGVDETGVSYDFLASAVDIVNDSINIVGHTLTNGTPVVFTNASTSTNATAPGNLSYNTIYFVVQSASGSFKLSATLNGVAINITTQGTGTHKIFSGFPSYSNVDLIKEADYINLVDKIAVIESEKLSIGPGQSTAEGVPTTGTSSQRTTAWNGTIVHQVTVDFGSANAARHFFNAGGELRVRATLAGASDPISTDWATLLTNAGTIKMNYTATVSTGSGTGSSIGYYDLTTANQQIFTKGGSGTYSANDYTVYARCDVANNSTGTARYVYFRIEFNDDKVGNPIFDEDVTGTLTSFVEHLRPTGPNVQLPRPTYTTTAGIA
jgi:hypothetical protein